ncbi:RtcB family protein [Flavihumibacter sp. UBA7668]|uniref:RtcB family protein n=1 Tax=Flavihumibacter sp. UBA7668 TaxID=1946542 RepID=UPI0025C000DD|nr:RtcB family protein [Flavihumibacter sp. UBA7668]
MKSIGFYCDTNSVEKNALEQLRQYAERPNLERINAYPDIHYCQEKALPVGVAFETTGYCYPLITGKDIGCGVMYLRISKEDWLKPFSKENHYRAFDFAHQRMTDEGLGGGNHFLSIEEDKTHVYILCHTGTRNRGIALYQDCVELTRTFSYEQGRELDYIPVSYLSEEFREYYQSVLEYGYQRRKAFCIKTLIFLQQAGYVRCRKEGISATYLQADFRQLPEYGELHGTSYQLEDSIHNHIRFERDKILHRKGSTEIQAGKTVVIPLSMSRGSLLVKAEDSPALADALYSCSHGAGRKLSRFNAMKYWRTTLKEKQRKAYREQFSELLNRSGEFPSGYIQEFDFAYKDSEDMLAQQPYLKLVTKTSPVATVKYSEI